MINVIQTEILGVVIIEPKLFGDERGYFMETWSQKDFDEQVRPIKFVQDNESKSCYGVLRGLHFQLPPKAQAKLVRCIEGEIFDVAVDIRKNSPTYSKWVGEKLSAENKRMLFIPEGFAHGFVVLSETAQLLYKASNEYSKELDRGILWNDPQIAVNWGINFEPVLSEKDKNQPKLCEIEELK